MTDRPNVFSDEPWDRRGEQMQISSRFVGKAAGARELGASVHLLDPGSTGFFLHLHYGMDELFVVLDGRPTLRTGDEERQLEPGEVVVCPRGRDGLHTFANRSDAPVRILAISTAATPEVVLYPELGKFGVATRDPFFPPGDDPGVVGLFDLPDA